MVNDFRYIACAGKKKIKLGKSLLNVCETADNYWNQSCCYQLYSTQPCCTKLTKTKKKKKNKYLCQFFVNCVFKPGDDMTVKFFFKTYGKILFHGLVAIFLITRDQKIRDLN